MLPRRIAQRDQRGDDEIDRQEPHRNQRQLRRHPHDPAFHPQSRAEQREQGPDQEQRQHRVDHPLDPAREPFRPACRCFAGSPPSSPRWRSRRPGRTPASPETARSATGSRARCPASARPLPRHSRQRARRPASGPATTARIDMRPQEIDIAVAFGRGLAGDFGSARPERGHRGQYSAAATAPPSIGSKRS